MSRLFRSSAVFSVLTFLSRILGLLRDIVIATYFNVVQSDIFFVALRIPNTFRRFFAEGSFANAFVPVLSDYKVSRPRHEFQALIDSIFTVLAFCLLVLTFLGVFFSGAIISLGFISSDTHQALASLTLKITFPYILFISLTAFCSGILNVHGRFAIPAFTPVILNLSLIVFAFFFRDRFQSPVLALAWGVFIGGVLQLLIQLPTLWRLKCLPRPRLSPLSSGVKRVFTLMIPTLLGSSVGQINILLNTLLAGLLVTGSISSLYYSERLIELPVAIIGVALGTVILPKLSSLCAQKKYQAYQKTLIWAFQIAFLLATAATTGLFCLAYPIISALFERGEFLASNTYQASLSLKVFAFSVLSLVLVKVLVAAFYADQDTKTPAKIAIICLLINMAISLAFFRVYGHVGLAFASTVASWCNMSLLLFILWRKKVFYMTNCFLMFIVKVIIANISLAILLTKSYDWIIGDWFLLTSIERIAYIFILVLIGIFGYFVILSCLGVRFRRLISDHG